MTIEIPMEITITWFDLVPVALFVFCLLTQHVGDGPNFWMLFSMVCGVGSVLSAALIWFG